MNRPLGLSRWDDDFSVGDWALFNKRAWLVERIEDERALISDEDGKERWVNIDVLEKVVTK